MNLDENINNQVIGKLPFTGNWLVGATPAYQIPSHGTYMFGVGYALDFLAVDEMGKTSKGVSLDTFFGAENPDNFHSFGKSVLSPISGEIVTAHDGEEDHKVYRNLVTLIPYMLGQKNRIRNGVSAIAGNYIIIKDNASGYFIAIVHLKLDSIRVKKGDKVSVGEHIADCGNSGNSTQPHIHIQAMSSINFQTTTGIPMYFENYIQTSKNKEASILMARSFPQKGCIVNRVK